MEQLKEAFLARCEHRYKFKFRHAFKCRLTMKACKGQCDFARDFLPEIELAAQRQKQHWLAYAEYKRKQGL